MKVMSCVLKSKPLDWRLSVHLCNLKNTYVKSGLLILNSIFLALTGVNFLCFLLCLVCKISTTVSPHQQLLQITWLYFCNIFRPVAHKGSFGICRWLKNILGASSSKRMKASLQNHLLPDLLSNTFHYGETFHPLAFGQLQLDADSFPAAF